MAAPADVQSAAQPEALPEGYRKPAHGRGALRPFQKGNTANPMGFGGQYQECMRLYRDASPRAAKRMIELLDSKDERVVAVVAEKIMERAWGKVKEAAAEPNDPEATARRAQMRAEVIRMLQALAVPEPLTVENAVVVPAEPAESEPGDAGT